jgi:hypothetical protein
MSRCAIRSHPACPFIGRRAGWSVLLLTGAVAAPIAVSGQAPDTTMKVQSHQVKSGDTLWELARAYLADPHQWPAIYRLNAELVKDPHWIYPGEVLRVPGVATGADSGVSAPENRAADEAVAEPDTVPGALREPEEAAPVVEPASERRAEPDPRVHMAAGPGVPQPVVMREGEVYAAPWLERRGGPAEHGGLVALVEPPGITMSTDRERLLAQDRVYATLPAGSIPMAGDRYVAFAPGAEVGSDGQVMVPTAIVEVAQPGRGQAATVRVLRIFDDVRLGQALIPLQRFPIPNRTVPTRQELGFQARVIAIPGMPVVPSLQHYVVLDARLKDGVEIGDAFTLYRPAVAGDGVDVFPEEAIALVQVVRVTDRGATAIIVGQRHPTITVGTRARLTAKMP